MLPKEIANHISHLYKEKITNFSHEGGGCINMSGKVMMESGQTVFVKWNSARLYPQMFEKEAQGLTLLSQQKAIKIPQVIDYAIDRDIAFLIMEYIPRGYSSSKFWEDLGVGLAQMHRHSQQDYGLSFDNYIGSLPQKNTTLDSWPSFFIENRLDPLVRKAYEQGELTTSLLQDFEKAYSIFETLCKTTESPSLLHGDLWSGNVFASDQEVPVLFDPAVYYGHREMDIAFTELFAGFSEQFYAAYQATFPLKEGYRERVDMYQLYPLLVHVILFGSGYLGSLKSALYRYI